MVVNTETHKYLKGIEWVTVEWSALNGACISQPLTDKAWGTDMCVCVWGGVGVGRNFIEARGPDFFVGEDW